MKARPTEVSSAPANGSVESAVPRCHTYAKAIRLIELGARATLVCQLTCLPRTTVKGWYQQIHGHPSPPGLAPFSDAWYVQTEKRMLHTNIMWKLDVETARHVDDPAQRLIAAYESYLCTVAIPLLNVTRAYFVQRLLRINAWRTACCKHCGILHIGPVTGIAPVCPACTIQRIYRCPNCNGALRQSRAGQRIKRCSSCPGSTRH